MLEGRGATGILGGGGGGGGGLVTVECHEFSSQ